MIELIVVVRIHDLNFLGLLRLDTDVTLWTLYSVVPNLIISHILYNNIYIRNVYCYLIKTN